MAKKKTAPIAQPLDPEIMQPTSPAEVLSRAWLFYSRQKYDLALIDFQSVLEQEDNNFDALFGLSLTHKANGQNSQALQAFEKLFALLPSIQDQQRASIMHRLILGHINQIKTGDWNLEKEVWH